MSIFIKVNGTEYPAEVSGSKRDINWGGRDTETIYLTMDYAAAAALLPAGTPWSIVKRDTVDKLGEDGTPTGEKEEIVQEWDNSDYSLPGPITDYRNGTASIKMGKPTEAETLRAQLAEIEEAYDEQ